MYFPIQFFHSLGALLWFDTPELRSLVIIDLQWLVDAVGCLVRYHTGVHFDPKFANSARQHHLEDEFQTFVDTARATLPLLEKVVWAEPRFAPRWQQLIKIVINSGIAVPLRSAEKDLLLVPSLLRQGDSYDTPDDAPRCRLHFRLKGSGTSELKPIEESELCRGFLPRGAYDQLCATLLAWSQSTVKGTKPAVQRGSMKVQLANKKVVLTYDEASNAIDVVLSTGGTFLPGAFFALACRLKLLVASLLKQSFANLYCSLLVSPAGSNVWLDHEALSNEVGSLNVCLGDKVHSVDALRHDQAIAVWLRPPAPEATFDLFLSYTKLDAPFTNALYDCCTAADGVHTFLDRCTLSVGEPLVTSCLLALSHTKVIVPVVTCAALRRLSVLTEDSPLSYLLVEWTFAVLLHMMHGVRLLPVFVGADDDGNNALGSDLLRARPPKTNARGDGNELDEKGDPLPDQRCLTARAPAIKVTAVHKELQLFFEQHRSVLPVKAEELTVEFVVGKICQTNGQTTWDSAHSSLGEKGFSLAAMQLHWGLHEALAEALVQAAREAPKALEAASLFAKPAYEEGVGASFKEHFERIEHNQKMLLQGQRGIKSGLTEIKSDVKAIIQMSEAHFKMLSTLLSGVDKLAPKLICFLPVAENKSWLHTFKNPKDWFKQRVRIFFIDPFELTLAETNGGKGFELDFPNDWVAKSLPYVKLGLTVLKVAAVAGRLGGIPIPDIKAVAGDWIQKQLDMVNELKDEALKSMSEMTKSPKLAEELLGKVDQRCSEMLSEAAGGAAVAGGEPLGDKLRAPLEKSLKVCGSITPLCLLGSR